MILLRNLFSDHPKYKKGAKWGAILWTLLLFILCFIPAREIPDIDIPLIDKWVHFVLFGVFSLLWLLAISQPRNFHLWSVFLMASVLGWLVEVLQGQLTALGRYQDPMDTLADSIGGAIGVVLFYILKRYYHQNPKK
jgi:VanZ family protein